MCQGRRGSTEGSFQQMVLERHDICMQTLNWTQTNCAALFRHNWKWVSALDTELKPTEQDNAKRECKWAYVWVWQRLSDTMAKEQSMEKLIDTLKHGRLSHGLKLASKTQHCHQRGAFRRGAAEGKLDDGGHAFKGGYDIQVFSAPRLWDGHASPDVPPLEKLTTIWKSYRSTYPWPENCELWAEPSIFLWRYLRYMLESQGSHS